MTKIQQILALMRKLYVELLLVIVILIIMANVAILHSSPIGIVTSCVYIVLVGYLLGNMFFESENHLLIRYAFGVFLGISLVILVGVPLIIFYRLNIYGLAVILLGPQLSLIILARIRKQSLGYKEIKAKKDDAKPYFSKEYVLFLAPVVYALYLLIEARSGWVYGPVWGVISPSIFLAYFFAASVLVGIILYSRTKAISKIALTITFSLLSIMVFAIVLFPGNSGDSAAHMGWAQMIVDNGNLRTYSYSHQLNPWTLYWLLKTKGLALLTAVFAKTLMVDVYWSHTFLTPILWGVFVPLSVYKMAQILALGEKVSLLASFLASCATLFIQWGAKPTANTLGFVSLFVVFYISGSYLQHGNRMKLLVALISVAASGLVHPLTGVMSFVSIFMAFSLRRYEVTRSQGFLKPKLVVAVSFAVCVVAILAVFSMNNIIYLFAPGFVASSYSEEVIALSLAELQNATPWELIFGEFMVYSFEELVLRGLSPFLGILGMVYTLRKTSHGKRVLVLFPLLVFIITLVDYWITQHIMLNVPFSPTRFLPFRDFIATPFAALTIVISASFVRGSSLNKRVKLASDLKRRILNLPVRRIILGLLICLSLSGFSVSSIQMGYSRLRGLHPTQLELEAIRYIDEHAEGRYVVITMPSTATIATAFLGTKNPEKYYVYTKGSGGYLGQNPSVTSMYENMEMYGADTGYFIASSFRTSNFDSVINEASKIFSTYAVFNDEHGEVYIFQYRIPPLPIGPNVMAFYWDAPLGYYIQNNLLRVIFNPTMLTLEVVDYWGDLYERVNLGEVSIGGSTLGNLTAVEYYDPSSESWVEWNENEQISSAAMTDQFRFKLDFRNDSLIGVVERDDPLLNLMWESSRASTMNLEVGDFTRLYIPGLIGGVNSYDTNSREYGFFFTQSLTGGVTLHPRHMYALSTPSLTFNEIVTHSNFNMTKGYASYDLYVENNASVDQWALIEVWLPDVIYAGTFPPLAYSNDEGETWTTVVGSREPITTAEGVRVNWVVSKPRWYGSTESETPEVWRYSNEGIGGFPLLPENFTESGGGQNRLIYCIFLPTGDEALIRLGISVYYVRPLETTYYFSDSSNDSYGLSKIARGLIALYNLGSGEYVGGIMLTDAPTELNVVQDETNRMRSIHITIPEGNVFSLLSSTGVDTTFDQNENQVPDYIESLGLQP